MEVLLVLVALILLAFLALPVVAVVRTALHGAHRPPVRKRTA